MSEDGAGYPGVASLDILDNVIPFISGEVEKLQPIAERMKGSVEVTSQRKSLTTITFGFPNLNVQN